MWLCSLAYSLGAPPKQCETLLKPLNALGVPLSKLNLDLSGVTAATTHYDVVPPPADAYGERPAPGHEPQGQEQAAAGRQPGPDVRRDPLAAVKRLTRRTPGTSIIGGRSPTATSLDR